MVKERGTKKTNKQTNYKQPKDKVNFRKQDKYQLQLDEMHIALQRISLCSLAYPNYGGSECASFV